jgi:hypothetical protein
MKNNGTMGKAGASFTIMGMNIPRRALIGMRGILVLLAAHCFLIHNQLFL